MLGSGRKFRVLGFRILGSWGLMVLGRGGGREGERRGLERESGEGQAGRQGTETERGRERERERERRPFGSSELPEAGPVSPNLVFRVFV